MFRSPILVIGHSALPKLFNYLPLVPTRYLNHFIRVILSHSRIFYSLSILVLQLEPILWTFCFSGHNIKLNMDTLICAKLDYAWYSYTQQYTIYPKFNIKLMFLKHNYLLQKFLYLNTVKILELNYNYD